MKKTLFIFLLGVSVLAEANTQTIGIGAYYKNSVYHSKNQVNALPIINLEYNRFYLKGYKPGFIFYKESDINFSAIIDPIGGYSDFAIRKSKFKDGYKNLDSRNTQVMGGFALDDKISKEVFEKKNNELERELFLLTQEKNKISASKKINRENIEAFIRNFKANFNKENIKKAIIETFVKEIKVYETYVEIVLRLFPMYIDRNGGDDENRTRVRNHNDHKPLQV